MGIRTKVRDRDPALTCRRILLTVNAVGEDVPAQVVEWITLTIDGDDGDILRIKAFALKAHTGEGNDDTRVTPHEAVAAIRDICIRRLAA